MKAVAFDTFGGALTLRDLPDPSPPNDGVVIQVRANGICRSDWHGWQGHDGDIQVFPHVPGHELAGDVVAVGKDVRRWQIGDRVTVPFCLGCGSCPQCVTGNHQVCDDYYQPGFTGWGAFAQYVALPYADVNLVRLPDEIRYVESASLGCRFTTAFRGIVAQGQVQPGEYVAVFGCGGVGLSAVMIAAASGATVIAVDIQDNALALAKQFGASVTVNANNTTDIVSTVLEFSRGGVHLSMDALGSATTCHNSILSLRKRGRHIQVGLLKGNDEDPPLPLGTVISKELKIIGSHGMQAFAFPDLLAMIQDKKINPVELVTEQVRLEDAPAILERMSTFDVHGVVVIDQF